MNIYNILFPPETEYVGWVQFATLNKGELHSLGYTDFEHIEEKAENLKIKKSQNYYIMANTVKRFTKRTSDNLFSLNNIVIDIDCHSKSNVISRYEVIQLTEEIGWRLNRDLFTTGELPTPNIVHYTGRGVQLWFSIFSANGEKLLFLYHKAIDYIAVIIREWLKEYPTLQRHFEIDISASKNAVGLFRMFNTYNTKAKTMTVADILHDKKINLNDLVKQLEESEPVQEYLKRKEQIKKRYKQQLNEDYEPEERKNGYSALHYKRIKIIEELARETENPVGHRDMMIFLAFNSARQIYPFETAKKICRKINRSFSEPLPDIEYIFKQDKVYQIKNSTFFEKLGVSQDELINMGKYEMSRPNITRDLARGQRKAERQMKKDMAEKFIKSGMTHKEVAERTGLSLSTVSKISAGIPKSKKRKN